MDTYILIPYHPYGEWIKTTSKESLFISLSVIPKTMVSTLLSVNIFTDRPSLWVLDVHHGYNYSYHRVQN
jgi:hypothetical protein